MSMAGFVCNEYGDGKAVADEKTRERIVATGIRRTAWATTIDTKTIMRITRGEPVKPVTLARVIKFVDKK